MGKLGNIGRIILTVYPNDHLPPHFHAIHPDFEALIVIETLDIHAGELKGAARKKVMAWATANIAAIKAEWNRLHPRFPV